MDLGADGLDLRFSEAELDAQQAEITTFISELLDQTGAETAVIGLSGGIDSSLTAHLAVEALGVDSVYGLVLPGAVSQKGNMSDAAQLATDLGIEFDTVPIDPLVDAALEAYPAVSGDEKVIGNARARLRALLLYLGANHRDGIVLGTGNRSEALVGYFTKYGDGAVDCHPIGALYKQQVRQLARHVGVAEQLITKPSTAGLWADQTDESELGLDYETLDSILALHVDGPLSKSATARTLEIDGSVVERVRSLHETSAHKRNVPPTP